MTADAVRAELERLRGAGEKLRARPARDTLDALARALDRWSDAGSEVRRELETRLPAATGFSPEVVREGLARALAGFDGAALRELVRRELGPLERFDAPGARMLSGFECTSVLLAGALPTPTLIALIAPLVLRSPVLAKTSKHDPLTAELVARSLAAEDPALGAAISVQAFAGGDDAHAAALLEADCVVASGSDETIARVAARVGGSQRLVRYGHRLSLAALDATALDARSLDDALARLALDVALWDQQGCLSPLALYAVGGGSGAAARVAAVLAQALAQAQTRLPCGRIPLEAAERVSRERADAELRVAANRCVALHAGADLGWSVVCEADARFRPAPLHRFVRVHPVADVAELIAALRPVAVHLASVGLEGFARQTPELARALANLGASRMCRFGEMQAPPLDWHHDGRPVLLPLARFSDLERSGAR